MAVGLSRYRQIVSAFFLAASVLASVAFAQTAPSSANETVPTTAAPPPVGTTTVAPPVTPFQQHSRHKRSPYSSLSVSNRSRDYYRVAWGVDLMSAKLVESGQIVRFSYRVVDPKSAKTLNDKKLNPVLIDEAAHVKLIVPSLEKVGELRQSSAPEEGKVYWMAFSNRGGPVKRGDRVSVGIGRFRADGLIVE
jgi:hypothetical protein